MAFSRLFFLLSLISASVAARAEEVFVDFGKASPTGAVSAATLVRSGSIALKTNQGRTTPFTLHVLAPFNAVYDNAGLSTDPALDGVYGNTALFAGFQAPKAALEVRGLDPERLYSFELYASRLTQEDAYKRIVKYEAFGRNQRSALLDATNNRTRRAILPGIHPTADGVIRIEAGPGEGNDTPSGFYHLSGIHFYAVEMLQADFGQVTEAMPSGWSDARALVRSGTAALTQWNGASSPYRLVLTAPFNDRHHQGTAAADAPLALPTAASVDGVFGNSQLYNGFTAPKAVLEVRNLDPARYYSFEFFASRMTTDDHYKRLTDFRVLGLNGSSQHDVLDATNNTGRIAYIWGVKPTAAGVLRIEVTLGIGNDTPSGFFHLSSMRLRSLIPLFGASPVPSPTPAPTATPKPSPTATPASTPLPTPNPGNTRPNVNLSHDRVIVGTSAYLTAVANDADKQPLTFRWEQVSGPNRAAVSHLAGYQTSSTWPDACPGRVSPIENGNWCNRTQVSGLVAGVYEFKVTVNDTQRGYRADSVRVYVGAKGCNLQPAGIGGATRSIRLCDVGSSDAQMGYMEYVPPNYGSKAAWPLVIFLHGIGENGDGHTNLYRVAGFGPTYYTQSRSADLPFIVISVQNARSQYGQYSSAQIDSVIEHAKRLYKIDPARIHVTGLSLGGGGTISYAAAYGAKLASIAPICPGYLSGAVSGATGSTDPKWAALASTLLTQKVAYWGASAHNDNAANFDNLTRALLWALGRAQGQKQELLYNLSSARGRYSPAVSPLPYTAVKNVDAGVINTATGLPYLPKGTYSSTYNASTGMWDWKAGQDYRNASGLQPANKLAFTFYTDFADSGAHVVWNRMYLDPNFYKWIEAQHR